MDGVDGASCTPVGNHYTYNQGVLMSGLTALSRVPASSAECPNWTPRSAERRTTAS